MIGPLRPEKSLKNEVNWGALRWMVWRTELWIKAERVWEQIGGGLSGG